MNYYCMWTINLNMNKNNTINVTRYFSDSVTYYEDIEFITSGMSLQSLIDNYQTVSYTNSS